MCSGRALMVMAIVYEKVGSTTRRSPAITRVRSDDVIPQWPIQRRIGNQYRRATVNAMTNERIMIGLRGFCGDRAAPTNRVDARILPESTGDIARAAQGFRRNPADIR